MYKILVVDDEVVVTMQLEKNLASMGYAVVGAASSGEEAIEMARHLKPDLILMDIVMPGKLDGIEASEIIKAELDIPVIFLTAYTDDEFIKRAKNATPFGYIVKPFHNREIMAVIEVARCKKKVEMELKESEERFRAIFETAQDSIFIKDRTLKYTLVNPVVERLFGLPASKLIGLRDEDIFPEEAASHIREVDSRVLGGETIEEEHTKPVKEVPHTFDIIKVPMYDSSGEIIGLCGIARDITERKQAEEALRYSRYMLQTILDSIPDGVFWKDRDSIYLGGNRTWLEKAGLKSLEEVVGKSDYDLPWDKKQADSYREDDRTVIESGIPKYDIIEPYLQADGTHAWAKTNKVPLRDTKGNVVGVLGTYEDITERKQAEEELQERMNELETFYRTTMGREKRVIEMKQEVNELLEQLGKNKKYRDYSKE